MKGIEYCVSGIDTDCGKTYITGLLAYHLKKAGVKIITSKLVQTGCQGISEDILEHRRIMESEILPEDKSGLTCPYVFSYPASPHLSAKIDNKPIDTSIIRKSTERLLNNYDIVLTEGAGGLMVPVTSSYFTIDYIKEHALPLILVSSAKLGSINHTLMSIELCLHHNINLHTFVYNKMPNDDPVIANDSFAFFKDYLKIKFPDVHLVHSDLLDKKSEMTVVDFLL
ncbi:MAG: ATP-dependent dethiobiotin synthetase BioD [bacterium]|nr:MAG: ATP-dependent dethiobiotin synthetase BioD [bacterium]